MNKDLLNTTLPCLVLDKNSTILNCNTEFTDKVFQGITIGKSLVEQFLEQFPHRTYHQQLVEFTLQLPQMHSNFLINHILFIPKIKKLLTFKFSAIEYWYLQKFTIKDEFYILFHNENQIGNSSKVFTNIFEIFKKSGNEIKLNPYTQKNSNFKKYYRNPFLYCFLMPHIAKSHFHLLNDKTYLGFFENTSETDRLQLDKEISDVCEENIGLTQFKEKFPSGNFIPFASCGVPYLLKF